MSVVCFSDLHGNYNLWLQIKKYYKENDTLIFLGDAIDRGPDGIKILQEMFQDKRIIFLLGNHEDMLLKYIDNGIKSSLITDKEIITCNGSYKTLLDFNELNDLDKITLINNLKNKTKNYYIYINKDKKNIFLSHAGLSFNKIYNFEKNNLLWDRDHIKIDKWNNKYKYWYIVHGHTPIQLLNPNKVIPEINRYCNRHKIDIDIGTIISKTIAVLNLDTLQVKYFKEEENNESRDNE